MIGFRMKLEHLSRHDLVIDVSAISLSHLNPFPQSEQSTWNKRLVHYVEYAYGNDHEEDV